MDDRSVSGTVLIVEDEPQVRQFVNKVLTRAGYDTIVAGSAKEAADKVQSHPGPVALVVSDIRMPGGSGLDLANDLATIRPGTPVLYISGLVDSIVVESIARQDPLVLLMKPFTAQELLNRVRRMLASTSYGCPSGAAF